jgi:hypothetical protein
MISHTSDAVVGQGADGKRPAKLRGDALLVIKPESASDLICLRLAKLLAAWNH